MNRLTKVFVSAGAALILTCGLPLLAQTTDQPGGTPPSTTTPDQPTTPTTPSPGAQRADTALTNAITTLQRVLADLPPQASDAAREALTRNIARLQAAHAEAVSTLKKAESKPAPSDQQIDRAVASVTKSLDQSSNELQALVSGNKVPASAATGIQTALASMSEGRNAALEALHRERPERPAGGRPVSASSRPSHPEKPSHPSKP